MSLIERIQRPEWTDLAVVMGPNVRWVECDYEDLVRYAPEVLLGYRVLLATPDSALRLRGRNIRKLVLLKGLDHSNQSHCSAIQDAVAMTRMLDGKVEWFDVHRGSDPVVRKMG